jgi:hypothetical protein
LCYIISMLKTWSIATAVLTVVAAGIVVWQANRCYSAAEQCKAAKSQYGPPPAINGEKEQFKSENQKGNGCYDANNFLCSVVTPANLPSLLLIVIGIGGIIVGVLTLDVLNEQTGATREAAKAAADSVTAIDRQAGIAERQISLLIAQGRPRIKVEIDNFEFSVGGPLQKLSYRIHCSCPTRAFIESAKEEAYFAEPLGKVSLKNPISELPVIINETTTVAASTFIWEFDREVVAKRVRAGDLHFQVWIEYRGDGLATTDPPYKTTCHWTLVCSPNPIASLGEMNVWVESGLPEDNQET